MRCLIVTAALALSGVSIADIWTIGNPSLVGLNKIQATADAPLCGPTPTVKMPHDAPLRELPGISTFMVFQNDLYSGARPEEIVGAQSLYALGVRTIISVDSVPPDRRSAEQLGISLIHIPLNYSGPDKHQIVDLTTAYAMARGDGKVYVHCHHGVHRAPTACALISIAIGISTPEQAQAKMAIAGTSKHYPMLWTSVDMQTPIDMLDVVSNIHILPSAVTPSDIASSMTMIDEAIMRLERIRDYGWSIPPDHPDLAPASDAGLIAETLRTLPSSPQWGTFGLALSDAEAAVHAAAALEQLLLLDSSNATALNMKLNLVRQSCTQCHGNLRNNLGSAGQRLVIVE